MGPCSPSKVFSVSAAKGRLLGGLSFCPAGSVDARQVFPQPAARPASAAFAFVNLDTHAADLVVPGAFEHSPFYEGLFGGRRSISCIDKPCQWLMSR
jgi:hypothetical protein